LEIITGIRSSVCASACNTYYSVLDELLFVIAAKHYHFAGAILLLVMSQPFPIIPYFIISVLRLAKGWLLQLFHLCAMRCKPFVITAAG
jgi:hypothetical protein